MRPFKRYFVKAILPEYVGTLTRLFVAFDSSIIAAESLEVEAWTRLVPKVLRHLDKQQG